MTNHTPRTLSSANGQRHCATQRPRLSLTTPNPRGAGGSSAAGPKPGRNSFTVKLGRLLRLPQLLVDHSGCGDAFERGRSRPSTSPANSNPPGHKLFFLLIRPMLLRLERDLSSCCLLRLSAALSEVATQPARSHLGLRCDMLALSSSVIREIRCSRASQTANSLAIIEQNVMVRILAASLF